MTIQELKEIIDNNIEGAEAGSLQAQGQVIEAQAEIDRIKAIIDERDKAFMLAVESGDWDGENVEGDFSTIGPVEASMLEREEDREFEGQFHDQWEEKDFFWGNPPLTPLLTARGFLVH